MLLVNNIQYLSCLYFTQLIAIHILIHVVFTFIGENLCFIQKTRIIDRNRFDLYVNIMTHVLSLKYSTTWLVGSNFIWMVIWISPLIYGMLVNVSVSTRNKIANRFYLGHICISVTVKYNNNLPDSTVLNLVKIDNLLKLCFKI
jgi:hypothetical protein